MAPSNMDYENEVQTTECYTHKKFKTSAYTHKKFSKKASSSGKEKEAVATTSPTPLFRPYALSENTPRKRRQVTEIQQHQPQYHSLPPTPPTTPPQHQQQLQHSQYPVTSPLPATTMPSHTPVLSHQAYAYMLQKQRTVLQMRQLLSINPDANTWPVEWRQALQALLHQ
ncbi:uncharacterized protein [Drosophila kikkawai]|uniref:Uncharacterized protein LOC108072618 n=1 Tax=Drosophila kikkawai TaxID=30033 RepID=A0A6P4I678_DROKI|nr:uncharacterized protein LOC108072618 [Drosophila kikkawai]